jgi:hypothetical protein
MAVCLVMQFTGVDNKKYDAVMEKLGLSGKDGNWPKGIISHIAGNTSDGFCVVDVWETQQDFDAFMGSRLQPAFDAVGGLPQPRVTTFGVHNTYRSKG